MLSRKKASQIIAIKHLPFNQGTTEALSEESLFITDDSQAENLANFPDNEKATQLLAISMGQLAEEVFSGIYSPTKNNPIYPMEVFMAFHAQGLYPPVWVLNWLGDAFSAYFKSKGEESLDGLLGIKRKKGQTPVFKEAKNIDIERIIMQEIGLLNLIGISVENAAVMVASRLESKNLKCQTAEILAERYIKRGWSKGFNAVRDGLPEISDDDKKTIIHQYPEHSIPAKIKATLLA